MRKISTTAVIIALMCAAMAFAIISGSKNDSDSYESVARSGVHF